MAPEFQDFSGDMETVWCQFDDFFNCDGINIHILKKKKKKKLENNFCSTRRL